MNPKAPMHWRVLAVALAVALAGAPVVQAAETVTLSGRIFQADGTTPLQGATVRVINQETGEMFQSGDTDASGKYEFENLPAGTYTFEVEVADGVFQLDRAVQLGDSETASISFTVKPEDEDPGAAGKGEGMSKKKKGALTAFIAGGAILLAIALDDDDDDASPFTP